jgi:hypothetical protein
MGKSIAVDGCKLTISSGGKGPEPTIKSKPSDVVFVSGKGVFFKEIKFEVSGVTSGDIANADGTGEGTILGTGKSILDISGGNQDKVVLEGDESVEIPVKGTKPSQSGSVPASGKIKVKVLSAGQAKVVAL